MGNKKGKWKRTKAGISNGLWTINIRTESSSDIEGVVLNKDSRWEWSYLPKDDQLIMPHVGPREPYGRPLCIPLYVWHKVVDHARKLADIREKNSSGMRRKSTKDPLVSFLYELMRDHVTPGVVEKVMSQTVPFTEHRLTNGYLADYAEDVAKRLRKK